MAAKVPRVLARERGGEWHVAIRTYQATADTACGRTVRTDFFATEGHPEIMFTLDGTCGSCRRAARNQ